MTLSNLSRLAAVAAAVNLGAWGQTPLSFEVASIKRNAGVSPNTSINTSGGRLTVTNASLKTLIRNAYEILSFQLAGGPKWLDSEMFDIVATTGTPGKVSHEEFKKLLQSLLADRFQLKVHWETRETAVYALVATRDGPKISKSNDANEPGINTQKAAGNAKMRGTNAPIALLASNLGNQLGRIVIDKTGLPGAYDWLLEWDPDPTADSTLPSLLAALPQQLGLKLEAQRGPMETLVIDRAEKPSEN